MANSQEASSSAGVQAHASELFFKERSEDESKRLQLKYRDHEQFIERVGEILACVGRGELEELKRLMEDVESVNVALRKEWGCRTPLIIAAACGHVEIVKWICDTRPERNMNALDHAGYTALCNALIHSEPEIVNNVLSKLLLAEDLDASLGQVSPLRIALLLRHDWSLIQQLLVWNSPNFPPIDVPYSRGRTTIHCAAFGGNVRVIDELLKAYPTMDAGVPNDDGWVPLHFAAVSGKIKAIQKLLVLKPELVNATENEWGLTPLHCAVLSNSPDAVEAILKAGGKDLKVDQPDWEGSTPLDYARSWYVHRKIILKCSIITEIVLMTRDNSRIMVKMLEGFDIHGLQTERQVYVDSANAILVGGALIASVTFSSWLQPPLGLTPYYESQFLMPFLAPPDTYESFVAIKDHWTIEMFWVFNTLSFFFAVATIIGGADAALPKRGMLLKDTVEQVRHAMLRASCLLVVSMVCVIGAFSSAGFTVLPPVYKYQRNMIGSVCVGGIACIFVLWKVVQKVFSWTSLQEIQEYIVDIYKRIRGYCISFGVFVQAN